MHFHYNYDAPSSTFYILLQFKNKIGYVGISVKSEYIDHGKSICENEFSELKTLVEVSIDIG